MAPGIDARGRAKALRVRSLLRVCHRRRRALRPPLQEARFTRTWHRDCVLIEEDGHVADLITAEAVKFIERKRNEPFFLYLPYTAPHIPIREPQAWEDFNWHIGDPAGRLYAACVSHMDDGIGKVIAALEPTGALRRLPNETGAAHSVCDPCV